MEYFREVTGLPHVSCHYLEVKEPVLKVLFAHNCNEQIEALAALLTSHPLADKFDFIRSERRFYEILPKGANKGSSLAKLTELLHLDMRKTIAVGDYNNDVSMIHQAGMGIAVANAVEEVKAVADYITVTNNENAIAVIIDELDKGVKKF